MVNFSIIIPTYNRPDLIVRALNSALKNIVKGDEIIIIDDASSKNYSEVTQKYDQPFIKYIRKTSNEGVSVTRNKGLEIARNDYIAFLDDDDEWYEDHLKHHRNAYEAKSNLAGIFCNFDNTYKDGTKTTNGIELWSEGKAKIQNLLTKEDQLNILKYPEILSGHHYKNQLLTDYILPSSFSFNLKICGNNNRFYAGLNRNETWLFNSHICSLGPIAFINTTTCIQHGDADCRYTDLNTFETIMSRLFVMSQEWGVNSDFLNQHSQLYDDTRFNDFYFAFRKTLKHKSLKELQKLIRLIGLFDFVRYSSRSIPYFFKIKKLSPRIT